MGSCGQVSNVESLAAYVQGKLSLRDFVWPPSLRPSLPFNSFPNSHLIPEIDLHALLSGTAGEIPLSVCPNDGFDDNNANCKLSSVCGSGELSSAASHELALLRKAATTCGFFQVLNHAVPISALETLHSYANKLFSMPVEHKLEVAKLLSSLTAGFKYNTGYMGGSPVYSPNKWLCESLRVASANKSNISEVARCLWPDEADQQAFSAALEECSNGFVKLSEQLARILLRELDIDADTVLREYVKGEQAVGVKLNHYPVWPQPDKALGLPLHTDVCLLTLLWQDDVGGRQVQLDGQWMNVKPRRDALVVTIGDILQVWSNDRYQSGVHRAVVNGNRSRYSIGFFYNPSGDTTLAPLPQLLTKTGQPPKFKSLLASDYRRSVFARLFQGEWQGVDSLRLGSQAAADKCA